MGNLNDAWIRARRVPGWYDDGDGLWLHCGDHPEGGGGLPVKEWVMVLQPPYGDRREVLGVYPEMGLRAARDAVRERRLEFLGGEGEAERLAAEVVRLRREVDRLEWAIESADYDCFAGAAAAWGRRFELACVELRERGDGAWFASVATVLSSAVDRCSEGDDLDGLTHIEEAAGALCQWYLAVRARCHEAGLTF